MHPLQQCESEKDPVPSLLYITHASLLIIIHCILLLSRGKLHFTVHQHLSSNIPKRDCSRGAIKYFLKLSYLRYSF